MIDETIDKMFTTIGKLSDLVKAKKDADAVLKFSQSVLCLAHAKFTHESERSQTKAPDELVDKLVSASVSIVDHLKNEQNCDFSHKFAQSVQNLMSTKAILKGEKIPASSKK